MYTREQEHWAYENRFCATHKAWANHQQGRAGSRARRLAAAWPTFLGGDEGLGLHECQRPSRGSRWRPGQPPRQGNWWVEARGHVEYGAWVARLMEGVLSLLASCYAST
ncbi:hypothetical protein RSOL_207170 [Rhizoctonia solani AG-3 Rhs1AP]|uniref:Uncharacterized protein n=1 Tax=Rhizoctonia solani AG-3 Rhs1AP TaxID=1086054 RepID=X8J718_9AGAM|nr:hypothetical protein RSOL_207170 [Rhizoctonia solani AG-3 Rhs1AP]